MVDFYQQNVTYDDPTYKPSFTSAMEWTRQPNATDAHEFLRAREQVVAHCLTQSGAETMRFVGTAATTRDLVAMVDAFDGPGAPINFLGMYQGTMVGSHLLASASLAAPLCGV